MKVYHGSSMIVKNPNLKHSRINIDFGPGFYLTKDKGMATKWAADKVTAVVNQYELNLNGLNIVKLDLTENWLDFVSSNRGFSDLTFDTTGVDVVIGPTADDKLFKTLELYFDGAIDSEQAIKYLNVAGYANQVVLKSEKALSQLRYVTHKTLNTAEKNDARNQAEYERKVANASLSKMMELDKQQKQETVLLQGDSDYDELD